MEQELLPELVEFSLTPYLGIEAAKRVAAEQPRPAAAEIEKAGIVGLMT